MQKMTFKTIKITSVLCCILLIAINSIPILSSQANASHSPKLLISCETAPDIVEFGASTVVDNEIKYEGDSSLKVTLDKTDGRFGFAYYFNETIDISEYDYLMFEVYTTEANGWVLSHTYELMYQLRPEESGRVRDIGRYLMYMSNVLEVGVWKTVCIPLTDFSELNVDLSAIDRFYFANPTGCWGGQEGCSFWIDNIRVEKAVKHNITASVEGNGSITPSGDTAVIDGSDYTYTFIADNDYMLDYLLIDGEKEPNANRFTTEYTFTNVKEAHSIKAVFKEAPNTFYQVTTDAGEHGKITPNTPQTVREGNYVDFTITPDSGYVIDKLLINGIEQNPSRNYKLENIMEDTHIQVTFKVPDSTDVPREQTLLFYDAETFNGTTQHGATVTVDSSKKSQGNSSIRIDSGAGGDLRFDLNLPETNIRGYDYMLIDVYSEVEDVFWKTNHLFYSISSELISEGEGGKGTFMKKFLKFNQNDTGDGWFTVAIPISQFGTAFNPRRVTKFCFGMDNGRWDGRSNITIWMDNIRFAKSAEFTYVSEQQFISDSADSIFENNGSADFVEDVYSEGTKSLHIVGDDLGAFDINVKLPYTGAGQYEYLQFDFRTSKTSTTDGIRYFAFGLGKEDEYLVADSGQYMSQRKLTANEWHTITIPLSRFAKVSDIKGVKYFRIVCSGQWFSSSLETEMWIDNVKFVSKQQVNYVAPEDPDPYDDDDFEISKPNYDDIDDDIFADFEFDYYMTPDELIVSNMDYPFENMGTIPENIPSTSDKSGFGIQIAFIIQLASLSLLFGLYVYPAYKRKKIK